MHVQSKNTLTQAIQTLQSTIKTTISAQTYKSILDCIEQLKRVQTKINNVEEGSGGFIDNNINQLQSVSAFLMNCSTDIHNYHNRYVSTTSDTNRYKNTIQKKGFWTKAIDVIAKAKSQADIQNNKRDEWRKITQQNEQLKKRLQQAEGKLNQQQIRVLKQSSLEIIAGNFKNMNNQWFIQNANSYSKISDFYNKYKLPTDVFQTFIIEFSKIKKLAEHSNNKQNITLLDKVCVQISDLQKEAKKYKSLLESVKADLPDSQAKIIKGCFAEQNYRMDENKISYKDTCSILKVVIDDYQSIAQLLSRLAIICGGEEPFYKSSNYTMSMRCNKMVDKIERDLKNGVQYMQSQTSMIPVTNAECSTSAMLTMIKSYRNYMDIKLSNNKIQVNNPTPINNPRIQHNSRVDNQGIMSEQQKQALIISKHFEQILADTHKRKQMQEMRQFIQKAKESSNKLKKKDSEYEKLIQKKQQQLSKLNQQIAQKTLRINELRVQLTTIQDKTNEITNLREQINQLKKQLQNRPKTQTAQSIRKQQVQDKQKDKDKKQQKQSDQKQLEAVRLALKDLNQKLSLKQKQYNSKRSSLTQLEKREKTKGQKVKEMEKKLSDMTKQKEQVDLIMKDMDSTKQIKQDLQKQIENLKIKKYQLNSQYQDQKSLIAGLEEQMKKQNTLKVQLNSLNNKVESLKLKEGELSSNIKYQETKICDLNKQIGDLTQQLEEINKNKDALAKQLTIQKQQYQFFINQFNSQKQKLNTEIMKASKELNDLRVVSREEMRTLDSIKELKKLKIEYKKQQSSFIVENNKIELQQKSITALQFNLRQSHMKNQELQKTIENIKKQIKQTIKKNELLQKQCQALNTLIEGFSKFCKQEIIFYQFKQQFGGIISTAQRQSLFKQLVELYEPSKIASIKLIFKHPLMSSDSCTQILEGKSRLVFVVRLVSGMAVAMHSEQAVNGVKRMATGKGKGFIASLTNCRFFAKRKDIQNAPTAIIKNGVLSFGADEIRLNIEQCCKLEVNVGFGSKNHSFETSQNTGYVLTDNRSCEIESYEIYELILEI